MVYDGKYYPCNEEYFKDSVVDFDKWKDFYPEAAEALPGKCIEPLGNPAYVKAFVDANHAGNMANRRSHTGILIYVNNAPIIWYSKRQNTVETSSFGSEYVALRICVEMIEAGTSSDASESLLRGLLMYANVRCILIRWVKSIN